MLLPIAGGAPAVWRTCLVFFQVTLLAGYAFTQATLERMPPRVQSLVSVALSPRARLFSGARRARDALDVRRGAVLRALDARARAAKVVLGDGLEARGGSLLFVRGLEHRFARGARGVSARDRARDRSRRPIARA